MRYLGSLRLACLCRPCTSGQVPSYTLASSESTPFCFWFMALMTSHTNNCTSSMLTLCLHDFVQCSCDVLSRCLRFNFTTRERAFCRCLLHDVPCRLLSALEFLAFLLRLPCLHHDLPLHRCLLIHTTCEHDTCFRPSTSLP